MKRNKRKESQTYVVEPTSPVDDRHDTLNRALVVVERARLEDVEDEPGIDRTLLGRNEA